MDRERLRRWREDLEDSVYQPLAEAECKEIADLLRYAEAQEQRIQELEGDKVRLFRKLRRIEAERDRWQRLCNAAEGELERG